MIRGRSYVGRAAAVLGMMLVGVSGARACIHVPREYKDAVTERTKEALLFHDGRNAHLVMKTNLAAKGKLPPSLAWVIPVPGLPSRYAEADPGLFQELFQATEPPVTPTAGFTRESKGVEPPMAAPPRAMMVHKEVKVGRYEIRPIEILDATAGSDLNSWLSRNGFGKVSLGLQKQYLRKKAVFLAVKISNFGDGGTVLKPLHIVYPADRAVMPLKFAENSGVFDVNLYTLTPKRLHGSHFGSSYLFGHGFTTELKTGEKTPILARLTGRQKGFLARFTGSQLNAPGRTVKSMPADPAISGATKLTLMAPPRPITPTQAHVGSLRVGARIALR